MTYEARIVTLAKFWYPNSHQDEEKKHATFVINVLTYAKLSCLRFHHIEILKKKENFISMGTKCIVLVTKMWIDTYM